MQGRRPSASTQDPEYRCDGAGADRFVVVMNGSVMELGAKGSSYRVVADVNPHRGGTFGDGKAV